MAFKLDEYQDVFIYDIGQACKNHKSVVAQLTTGGGKTVCFASITARFLEKTKKDVIIFCDSDKILEQTRLTLLRWYGIDTDIINAKSAHIKRNSLFGQPRVFVAMVETFDRRAGRETFLTQLNDVGLVIIDECHIGNFIKILDYFPFSLRIGFTATPISSDKKKPLNKYYETIVCGPSTEYLIDFGHKNPGRGLVQDVTYSLRNNIDRKAIEQEQLDLGYKGEDFNEDLTGKRLSGKKQIDNTIEAYVKHAPGKKMICFNTNVAHSLLVTEAMCKYGLNARHLDATCGQEYRTEIYGWLKKTSNAILCNVGMTTKGFDEPSLNGVILNRLTKSPALYNQMCGRSGRPFQYMDGSFKDHHIILDMCDNVLGGGHGQWSDHIDWEDIFRNPKKPKQGVAPMKECPECGYICPASARVCKGQVQDFFTGDGMSMMQCGYEFEVKEQGYDEVEKEMILVSKNIDVQKIVDFPAFQSKREYYTFYETVRACAYYTDQGVKEKVMDRNEFEECWKMTYTKIVEWQRIKGQKEHGRKKRDNEWYTTEGRKALLEYLRGYGFVIDLTQTEEEIEQDEHQLIIE